MAHRFLLFSSILLLLVSCKAKVPEDVIERDKMENVLYDYHLAQSLAKGGKDSVDYRIRLYTEAVFRKHGIDESKFNHSMEWYTRNSEELFVIYKRIDKRFAEARSVNVVQGNRYASMTEVGDTMNIWTGKDFYLLSSAWYNHLDFQQELDSTYVEGDRLMWQFDTHWYYREGQKSATAVLALVYEDGTSVSTTRSLYSTGSQDLYITVEDKPVKYVEGFIYLISPWSELPKILTIKEPVLVKFKKKKPGPALKMKDVLAAEKQGERLSPNNQLQVNETEQSDLKKLEADQETVANPENQRVLRLPR